MGRNNLVILIILVPVLITYNNCSRSEGDLGGSLAFSSVNSGASIFPGKSQLEYISHNPSCAADKGVASMRMDIDGNSGQATLQINDCNQSWQGKIDFQELRAQPYNEYLVYYDQKIFSHPDLHQGYSMPVFHKEFCHNSSEQMDFTIQYLFVDDSGLSIMVADWVGITLHGQESDIPGLHFAGGYIQENPDGTKVFYADNNTFEVEISVESGGTKQALYRKANGAEVLMDCWVVNE